MTAKKTSKSEFRSNFEAKLSESLTKRKADFQYEPGKVDYVVPSRRKLYLPDFVLHNGIVIEAKGYFQSADRQKARYIQDTHPDLDYRFVFMRPQNKLNKRSPTTYSAWCEKYGFPWAGVDVPDTWLKEPANEASVAILRSLKILP